MKEITIAVPDGMSAEWNEDGMLQLVKDNAQEQKRDDRPITERIKTFEDACKELGRRAENGDEDAANLLADYESNKDNILNKETLAYMKLAIITAAINEEWKPEFTEDEYRWYPCFLLWTKEELEDKTDEWKDKNQLLLWGGYANNGTNAVLGYAYSIYAFSGTIAYYGSRLAYKTEALADYSGRQFAQIWCQYHTGKEGTPWRNS